VFPSNNNVTTSCNSQTAELTPKTVKTPKTRNTPKREKTPKNSSSKRSTLEKQSSSTKNSSTKKKKRVRVEDDDDRRKTKQEFEVGLVYEAELSGVHKHYRDVIHPVTVLEFGGDTNTYRCQLNAFWEDASIDWYEASQLHQLRSSEPGPWKSGQHVHIRIRDRTVQGKLVDGRLSEVGVWVKATIVKRNGNTYTAQHTNWLDEGSIESQVMSTDIRSAFIE
jgi:hypothetical protein